MSDRKYASDYQLEEHVTITGTVERHRIYCGKYFSFALDAGEIRHCARKLLAACAGVLLLMLPLLFNNTQLGRMFYVLFPMAFALVPLYQLTAIAVRILKLSGPMTRQQRDQTEGRLGSCALWLTVLTGATFAGCGVFALNHGLSGPELLTTLSMALACGTGVWMFRQRSKFKTQEAPG